MKNMGVPVTALASADAMWRSTVGRCTLSRRSTALEAPDAEAQFVCVRDEIGEVQVVLALQQQRVHGPERSLCRCGFGCLRSQGRVRVDIAEREVAPDVVHLRVGEQFAVTGSVARQCGHSKSPYSTTVIGALGACR